MYRTFWGPMSAIRIPLIPGPRSCPMVALLCIRALAVVNWSRFAMRGIAAFRAGLNAIDTRAIRNTSA